MKEAGTPDVSVLFVTPGTFGTIRTTVGYLQKQTARDRMEIIMVVARDAGFVADAAALAVFHGHQTVPLERITSMAEGYSAGIRRARAPIVALAEDHSFPEPGWAAALIRRHREPWAVVGPSVRNANPQTAVSWADYFTGYGPWAHPQEAGERVILPGHNSCYKRELLLDYGDRLEGLMGSEAVLHWDLRTKGHRLYLDPAAVTQHMNFGVIRTWMPVQFYGAWVFGACRARTWPAWKRLLYAAGSPLTVPLRFRRILPYWKRCRHLPEYRRGGLFFVCLGLTIRALGEMTGYAFGGRRQEKKLFEWEARRIQHAGAAYHATLAETA